MKGIVLAGGSGTRLYPITMGVSKQLLPIYDKPMIYYPLSVLMLADIREILIITTPHDQEAFKKLLGDGSKFGCKFEYVVQEKPDGIAKAFILGEEFIGDDDVCLILGDNIFYGPGFPELLKSAKLSVEQSQVAAIFTYPVPDPHRFGVVEIAPNGEIISIEEKPENPKSNQAVVGLYMYPNSVIEVAKSLKPSKRNELEITDVNKAYLELGDIDVFSLRQSYFWLDTGTFDSLADATQLVRMIQTRTNTRIACLEEIAFNNGWISSQDLINAYLPIQQNSYGQYLMKL